MVAIPEFAMGAMENWGLVTYRDVDLLIDPVTASNSQKQRVCTVVCHELAHQWFGNLVTMTWWDDLWLNEGFASWAENYAANEAFPDYEMWSQFVNDHLSRALKLDGLLSSHPIQVPIHHAEEVEQVFDAISYCKGGSVVRMIRAVLGMPKFKEGLSHYMKKFAYGNTETLDLWGAWQVRPCD
jgi:puromycin-sensitive aminopeptidase